MIGNMKLFSIIFSIMVLLACVSAAPSIYSGGDDEATIGELVEMLLQRQRDNIGLDDSRIGYHQVSRKAGRSPQLRLRFGKRMDAKYQIPNYIAGLNDPIVGDNNN